MKRYIKADGAISTSKLYHGCDSIAGVDVQNSRDLGIHATHNILQACIIGLYIYSTDYSGNYTIELNDVGDWSSLSGLKQIFRIIDPEYAASGLVKDWRNNHFSGKGLSKEASTYFRNKLVNEYGITCIKYTSTEDSINGTCFLFLTDNVDWHLLTEGELANSIPEIAAIQRKLNKYTKCQIVMHPKGGDKYIRTGLVIDGYEYNIVIPGKYHNNSVLKYDDIINNNLEDFFNACVKVINFHTRVNKLLQK